MSIFRHHPDGWIYLEADCYPLAWFLAQEPGYRLPQEAIAREYIPDERHSLYSATSQWGGELPWAEGDRYLERAAEYRSAWQVANEPPPLVEPPPQPNWVQFRAQVSMHSAYFRLVTSHPQNIVLNDLLVPLLWSVGDNPALLPEVAQLWGAMVGNCPLTENEILQLSAIATACNVPLKLAIDGRMEAG